MSGRKRDDKEPIVLDNLGDLIEEITVDAYGEDEKLWAFREALEENMALPCEAFVIGEPVSLIEFDYDGNERRGLTARCRREDGSEHVVAASAVVVPQRSRGARYLAAYRKWLGFEPFHTSPAAAAHRTRGTKAAPTTSTRFLIDEARAPRGRDDSQEKG